MKRRTQCPKCKTFYGGVHGPEECACPILDRMSKNMEQRFAEAVEGVFAGARFRNLAANIHAAAVEAKVQLAHRRIEERYGNLSDRLASIEKSIKGLQWRTRQ